MGMSQIGWLLLKAPRFKVCLKLFFINVMGLMCRYVWHRSPQLFLAVMRSQANPVGSARSAF